MARLAHVCLNSCGVRPSSPTAFAAWFFAPSIRPSPGEGDTFPRSFVEDLRRGNARYRERARNADTDAKRLHIDLVRATGMLADPTSTSLRTISTTPTPWPPPSTTCWPASHTSRPAGRPVKSGREPHPRPRVALTLPHFCANEPDKEGTWVTSQS